MFCELSNEWNIRMKNHIEKIQNNTFISEDVFSLIYDLNHASMYKYKNYNSTENIYLINTLYSLLPNVKKEISEFFCISEDKILFGNYDPQKEEDCPYIVIFGNANLKYAKSADDLKCVFGSLICFQSNVTNLSNLWSVSDDAIFYKSKNIKIDKLSFIGRNGDFQCSKIESIPNLEEVGCNLVTCYSNISNASSLKIVHGNLNCSYSPMQKLTNLETVKLGANFKNTNNLEIPNLIYVKWEADFRNSTIKKDLNLKEVDGNLVINKNQLHLFKNLQKAQTIQIDDKKPIPFRDLAPYMDKNISPLLLMKANKVKSTVINKIKSPKTNDRQQ